MYRIKADLAFSPDRLLFGPPNTNGRKRCTADAPRGGFRLIYDIRRFTANSGGSACQSFEYISLNGPLHSTIRCLVASDQYLDGRSRRDANCRQRRGRALGYILSITGLPIGREM